MNPEIIFVYVVEYGYDYEGEEVQKVFGNRRSAELWLENHPGGDYSGVTEWEVES